MVVVYYGLGLFAADFVGTLHLVRIVADARYVERCVGRNQNRRAVCNARVDVLQRLVVPFVPRLQRLVDCWIAAEKRLCKAVFPRGELPVLPKGLAEKESRPVSADGGGLSASTQWQRPLARK